MFDRTHHIAPTGHLSQGGDIVDELDRDLAEPPRGHARRHDCSAPIELDPFMVRAGQIPSKRRSLAYA